MMIGFFSFTSEDEHDLMVYGESLGDLSIQFGLWKDNHTEDRGEAAVQVVVDCKPFPYVAAASGDS